MEHIEQYHIKFGDKSHNLKQRGRKAFAELLFSWSWFACWSNGFEHAFGYIIFFRIISTIFLCNKKYRSPCSFKRKGPLHLLRFPLDWEYSAMFEKERTGVFALLTISTLSLSFLFLLCHKFPPLFPNHAFPNAHFSRVRAFRRESRHYILLCYYAVYRMRSAILRNHLNWNFVFLYYWFVFPVFSHFAQNKCKMVGISLVQISIWLDLHSLCS